MHEIIKAQSGEECKGRDRQLITGDLIPADQLEQSPTAAEIERLHWCVL